MRDTTRAELLLSLFTSPDCATAIVGDLTEEAGKHGPNWFWLHVLGTALALWRRNLADAPLRVLALMLTGCVLLVAPTFAGVAAIAFFPPWNFSPVSSIVTSFCWWAGAFWVGASLVNTSPRRGMAACATLAAAGEVLVFAVGGTLLWYGELTPQDILLFVVALAAVVPLLAGAALARRRMIAWGIPALEQHP